MPEQKRQELIKSIHQSLYKRVAESQHDAESQYDAKWLDELEEITVRATEYDGQTEQDRRIESDNESEPNLYSNAKSFNNNAMNLFGSPKYLKAERYQSEKIKKYSSAQPQPIKQ